MKQTGDCGDSSACDLIYCHGLSFGSAVFEESSSVQGRIILDRGYGDKGKHQMPRHSKGKDLTKIPYIQPRGFSLLSPSPPLSVAH